MESENGPQNPGAIGAGLMLSLFVAAMDGSVVATAMPTIARELHSGSGYALPFVAYLLLSATALPIAGRLSDLLGRRRTMLIGLAGFLLASLLCGLSPSIAWLSAFRALQGAFGGVVASGTFVVTLGIFPPRERGRRIGMLASMYSLAAMVGPVLGGTLLRLGGWRWIFFLNAPLLIAAFALLARFLPALRPERGPSKGLDPLCVLLFLLAALPLLGTLVGSGSLVPWGIPVAALLSSGILFAALFAWREHRSAAPLLPRALLSAPAFRRSAIMAMSAHATLYALLLFVPYLLQVRRGWEPARAGLLLCILALAMTAGSLTGGAVAGRRREVRTIGGLGFLVALVGATLLCLGGLSIPAPFLALALLICGIGIGAVLPVLNMAAQSQVPREHLGSLVSSLEFLQILAGTAVTALGGHMLGRHLELVPVMGLASLGLGLIAAWGLPGARSEPQARCDN